MEIGLSVHGFSTVFSHCESMEMTNSLFKRDARCKYSSLHSLLHNHSGSGNECSRFFVLLPAVMEFCSQSSVVWPHFFSDSISGVHGL